ncbi:MAG: tRNA uridine-5-carboxymethylaminomethyl(34) synthesis GTPase MnmE [Chitinophagales bacterium]|nr:tRNA uridine-5-carboxymethylaminomethyl(34) synthesis GTPase MnmE [Chitinophagales bacterium]MBP8752570.1 tRNA uridine-5-carboxymethylaminomethyl(34) synthesis GTPase MnmE [Chitinophagales bacterium]MBP9187959.1 tRNA uridine-5-carboxymethylaminomethyl(34) synthesis GTPase MnmE [Chitinophagales bacterium]MBP9549780.1 tRNA uridine-5-carboxymethylaminomethyl(34) synthesis GTPase MnmE [Chitinophagales bacterium]MBP9704452.1 tRNA uridine-5-carboxymethylaminomethyl(34) synthesis GTPase MnmE [Chiti
MLTEDTIAALSTAPGVGAIAVLRLSGNEALHIANSIFSGTDLTKADSHTLHFGIIKSGDEKIDEVVIGIFKSPKSYTGEDVVEISCHGSIYITQRILQLLVSNGARLAKAGEFTMRAFLHGKMDLSQAEAVADLIASETKASHQLALQQMRGGYSETLKNLRYKLIEFGSLIELELDFSEEDVEFADRSHLVKLTEKIKEVIDQLILSFQLGNVIKLGVNTVIAGRPNAGKSTLLNALLNEERALVSEIAGTTRDTIEEELNIHGINFRMIDTAGIRESTDIIEKMGVEKTMEKIKTSTLLIYLFDVNTMTPEEVKNDLNALIETGDKLLLVANKIDKLDAGYKFSMFNAIKPDCYISSLEHTNLDELKEMMYKKVIQNNSYTESAIVSNIRHLEALQKAKEALQEIINAVENKVSGEFTALHIRSALNYIGEITGEVTHEDMLDFIFSKFCIGK